MKLKEAKMIVGYILQWQFVLMGNNKRNDIEIMDLSKYSLQDLLNANKIVESNNKRKRALHEYHKKKGHKTKGISTNLLLADRLIAAIYTALSFSPTGELIALINDVAVGCVTPKY